MSLAPLVGPHTIQYAASTLSIPSGLATLGTTTNEGISSKRIRESKELPAGVHGTTPLDSITQGEKMILSFAMLEFDNDQFRKLMNPVYFHTTTGITANTTGVKVREGLVLPAGVLGSDIAILLKITPVVSSRRHAYNPSTPSRLYRVCTIANSQDIDEVLSHNETIMPVQLLVLPYINSGNELAYWEYSA